METMQNAYLSGADLFLKSYPQLWMQWMATVQFLYVKFQMQYRWENKMSLLPLTVTSETEKPSNDFTFKT